ncbi:Serine/threonine protein kinase [Candidatus Terasakiella magnetica]|uniref:Serine/threonine protein kinase n=1 Tax=Candidatus Terasakiella magnetica TaxID=1867952 RepID=A0A1C3RL68_9PROT|nr:protein kinase family protein [Candidatus Terasakiella magnetica]SCA58024.1 Serine/threonine protein kinase [Candidatus Terasakiella magnetica]
MAEQENQNAQDQAQADQAAAQPKAEPPKAKGKPVPPVVLDRYNINPAMPIPELCTPSAKAYVAEDKRNTERKLFALVCPPFLGARTGVMDVLKGANIRGSMNLVEWGTVHWPLISQRTVVVIYERPTGGRLLDHLGQISQHEMVRKIIEPLCHGLMELSSRGVSHRQIRPSNLFFLDGSLDRLVLGDCTTVPPGYDQPILFETLERGAAPPAGRGAGDVADDMYAFGVSVIFAIAGGNPVPQLRTDDDILYSKMIEGSYTTLIGQEVIPPNMVECLRGLLSDDEHERWSLEQLDLWINGRRLTPIQKKSARKAKRYIDYAGREHFNTRTLSLAATRMPSQVDKLVKDDMLETWLKRDLEDSDLSAAASNAIHMAQSQSGDKDVLAARIGIVLDPTLPIRYKDCWCMPDGFGTMLAHSILHKGNANSPIELITRGLPRAWFDAQDTYNPVYVALEKNFDQLLDFVQERKIGYGVERVLYETNPTMACQSPLLVEEYVTTIKDLMPALERISAKVDKKKKPIDRHIVAFIAARLNQNIDPHVKAVGDDREEIATLGMLSLLALVQWRTKAGTMMGFTSWVGAHMGPAIKAYHSKSIREELEKEVPKLIRKGNLADLFNLLDNAEQRAQDQIEFDEACSEFEEAENEIKDIQNNEKSLQKNSNRMGQQAAAMTSIVISLLIITVTFIGRLW